MNDACAILPSVPALRSIAPTRPVSSPVDPSRTDDALSVDELGSRIVGLAGRLAAATGRWLLLVAAFDARSGFDRFGLPSTARWLSHHCGLSHRTAVEHVRVARALAAYPSLATEMAAGRLSYSQIRAITRLVCDGDESTVVADLIEVARNGTVSQLESVVRGLRTVEDNERDGAERPEPYLSHAWTGQSQWRATARLDPEDGALMQSVIEGIARDESITPAAAFVRMAEIALVALTDRDQPLRPLRGDERAAIVIHLEATQFPADSITSPQPAQSHQPEPQVDEPQAAEQPPEEQQPPVRGVGSRSRERDRGRPADQPAARVVDGPGLPLSVLLRLACSGRIRTVLHGKAGKHGQQRSVLDLGRTHRVVTALLFRALLLRDNGCTHPGCRSRAGLEAHHVRHWLWGGLTKPDNLVLLCSRHHHAHHAGEFFIAIAGPGEFRFFRADGRELERVIAPARLADTDQPIEDEHLDVTPDAASSQWRGEPLDRKWAVAVLAQRRHRTLQQPDAQDRWADLDPWAQTA